MEPKKFIEFWKAWSDKWVRTSIRRNGCESINVADVCYIRSNAADIVYKYYERMKETTKECYFQDKQSKKLSRYKRAAIICYAIIKADPLIYRYDDCKPIEKYFLKQRFAFMMGIGSIIQDYPEDKVKAIAGTIYDFSILCEDDNETDDFLLSIYKDLFFSEVFRNYNVLTMAKVFGLLTEKSSKLSDIKPLE